MASGAIYRIPANGGTRTRLARGAIGNMAVSPNGLRVVYQQIMGNRRTDLFVVPTAGGKTKNITRSATKSEYQPTWRDNATVAYARQVPKFNCRQPASSPDAKRLACSSPVKGSRILIRTFTWTGAGHTMLRIPASKPQWPTWASSSVIAYVAS
jgi:hypothetical protein